VDDESRQASRELADALRRMIARLALVRPPVDALRRAAAAANAFADSLETLPERSQSWEVSEAGLLPRDFVGHSPVSGPNNPIAPPLRMHVVGDASGDHHIEGSINFGPAYEGPPGHCHGGWVAAMFGELELRGWVDNVEGRKRTIRGTCSLDGVLLAEAIGLFIAPREGQNYLAILGKS
jgi:hypothetical protein